MKKNIISRMKSKKAQLAAGALAVILAMFPAETKAAPIEANATWTPPSQTAGSTNNDWWVMDSHDQAYTITAGNFTNNWQIGNVNYHRHANADFSPNPIPLYRLELAHWVSSGSAAATQMRLMGGGSILVTGWAGSTGTNNTNDAHLNMVHLGGAATLSFIDYNWNGTTGPQNLNVDGSVMRIDNGQYTLRANTTSVNTYNRYDATWDDGTDQRWEWNGSPTRAINGSYDADAWIYFDNNYGNNGGAIFLAGGGLNLEWASFGYTRHDNPLIGDFGDGNHAEGNGGAIYVGNVGANEGLKLSGIAFYSNTAKKSGGALYNAEGGKVANYVTEGSYWVNSFFLNRADVSGGAFYNAGTATIGATFGANSSIEGGAIYNDNSLYVTGDFINNTAVGAGNKGGAVYNNTRGNATFSQVAFTTNTALGGYGGAIYNQNQITLTNVIFDETDLGDGGNRAIDGGAIFNENGTITATTNVTFARNIASNTGAHATGTVGAGGAIYNHDGVLNLTGATFTSNTAVLTGGGIHTYLGTHTLTGNIFSYNIAGESGGAIYNDHAQLTIDSGTFTSNAATTVNGGAIYNDGGLFLTNRVVFQENTAVNGLGGAIYTAERATINLYNGNESLFERNTALNGGGAIYNDKGGILSINGGSAGVEFKSNWTSAAGANGGAIYSSENGDITLTNASFVNNTTNGGDGGAIYNEKNGLLTITGGRFTSNGINTTATLLTANGGAIYNGTGGVVTITGTVFNSNTATNDGGAIYNAEGGVITLTNVSFAMNTAGTAGGAIYTDGGTDGTTINVNVTNTAAANSTFGDGTANADTIFITGKKNEFNVDVSGLTRSLVMRAGMTSDAGSEVDIVKDGIGVWEYQTASTFSGDTANFTVEDGTLHMRSNSVLNLKGDPATTSLFELKKSTEAHVATWVSDSTYSGTASLIMETGSVITVDELVADGGSSIAVGIVTMDTTDPSFKVNNAATFALGLGAAADGSIVTDLYRINGQTTIIASGYNFSTTLGGGTPDVDAAGLHFENATYLATTGQGPFLDLRLTDPANTAARDVTMAADIYVRRPQDFVTNGYGVLVLAEVNNNGTFNNGTTPTSGNFYIYNGATYETGVKTPFTRSTADTRYEGISLTSNADNTGSWIIYAMMNENTNSEDLTWTGGVDGNWDSIDGSGVGATKNWTGMVKGIPVDQFLNGDAVSFQDTVNNVAVTNKNVTLTTDVTVGAMTVTGSDYTFNLNGFDITADTTYSSGFNGTGIVDFGGDTIIKVDRGSTTAPGSVITAESVILNTTSDVTKEYGLHFDTKTVTDDGMQFLQVALTTTGILNVASDIYITAPTPAFNGEMILVEVTNGTLTQTGDFYVDGYIPGPFERKATAGDTFLGIDVVDNDTKIVLHMVDKSTNSTNLTWAGVYPDGTTTGSTWVHNNIAVQNWRGTVSGNPVTTFLNGDTVTFADTFNGGNTVENKLVNVAATGVSVGDMTVTGSDYTFDLTNGTITAVENTALSQTGSIDFGTAAIRNGTGTVGATVGQTVTADGTINFAGANDFVFNLDGVTGDADPTVADVVLILDATGGVTGKIGDGNFTITNATLTGTEVIVLIDASGSTGNTVSIVDTGAILGQGGPIDRDQNFLGLLAWDSTGGGGTADQLLLKEITGGGNTTLYWSGATTVLADETIWNDDRTENDAGAENWAGRVNGNYTKKFLGGDTVFFSDTYKNESNSTTTVDPGKKHVVTAYDVVVNRMTVDGTGYTFDLANGGITATGADSVDPDGTTHKAIDFLVNADIDNINGDALIATDGSIRFVGGTLTFSGDGKINATDGDISFGAADIFGVSGTDAIKAVEGTDSAGGNIYFGTIATGDTTRTGAGTLSFSDATSLTATASIYADGDIDLADAVVQVLGEATSVMIEAGNDILITEADISGFSDDSRITAGRNITIAGGGTIDLGGFATMTATTGDISFGAASVSGISDVAGRNAIEATGGNIYFGSIATGDTTRTGAGTITFSDATSLTDTATIYADGDIDLADAVVEVLGAATSVTIEAGNDILITEANISGFSADSNITAGENITIAGGGSIDLEGFATMAATAGDIDFGSASVSGITNVAGRNAIEAGQDILADGGTFTVEADVATTIVAGQNITAGDIIFVVNGDAATTVEATAGDITADNFTFTVNEDSAITIEATAGNITIADTFNFTADGDGAATIEAGQSITADTFTLTMNGDGAATVEAGTGDITADTFTLTMNGDGAATIEATAGNITIADTFNFTADGDGAATIEAGQSITADTFTFTMNGDGAATIEAGQDIIVTDTFTFIAGDGVATIEAGNNITIDTAAISGFGAANSVITAGGNISIDAGTVDLEGVATMTATGTTSDIALGTVTVSGITGLNAIKAERDITAVNSIFNVDATAATSIVAGRNIGSIAGTDNFTFTVDGNEATSIEAGQNITANNFTFTADGGKATIVAGTGNIDIATANISGFGAADSAITAGNSIIVDAGTINLGGFAKMTATTGDIDFGTVTVSGISGTEAIKAGRDILGDNVTFTVTGTAATTIVAGRDIDITTANISGFGVANSAITATRNITVENGTINLGGFAKITAGTGNIDFGLTNIGGISDTDAIKAGGNIDFGVDLGGGTRTGGGELGFTSAATITAGGYINFADASIGTATAPIRNGSTVTATTGAISFGDNVSFYFDTASANASSKYLTLTPGVGGDISVTGDIYITTPTTPIAYNEHIVLIEASPQGSFFDPYTGTLHIIGSGSTTFERQETAGEYFLGIDVIDIGNRVDAAIALLMVDKSTNTDANSPLVWTGASSRANNGVWDVNQTRDWTGVIAGNTIETFLNGDTVLFDGTAATNRRTVNVWTGGVTVGDMSVDATLTGNDVYKFDLSNGGISAEINPITRSSGNIAFGNSIIKGISGNAISAEGDLSFGAGRLEFAGAATILADGDVDLANVTFGSTTNAAAGSIVAGTTIVAGGTISLDGGNTFNFDLTGVQPNGSQGMLTLNATSGVSGGLIGDGNIYVYNLSGTLGENDSIILVDAGLGNAVATDTGTLFLNGVEVLYERDKKILGLAVSDNNDQLLLKMIETSGLSTDLQWSGATSNVWDVNTTKNWAGNVEGHFVDTFLNYDTVVFADTYEDRNGVMQTVSNPRRNVIVAAGGVTVSKMTVDGITTGDNYTFDLVNGGITAIADPTDTTSGNIYFGGASVKNVSSATKISADGDITFAGIADQTISVTIGIAINDPVIVAGGNIALNNTTLNIDGYNGNYGDAPVAVIQANTAGRGGTLTGFTDYVVKDEDYIYVEAFQGKGLTDDANTIYVKSELYWLYETAADNKAHGDFTIKEDETFTLGTVLYDRDGSAEAQYRRDGSDGNPAWDGTTLTKYGEGTLVLTGNNTYSGGTTINDGRVVAGHIDALGSGDVLNNSELEIAASGNFDNVINGTGEVIANAGSGKTVTLTEHNTYTGDTTVQSGTLAIRHEDGAGANVATKTVDINAGAFFDLAFAGATVDPCAVSGGTAYNQKITGEGALIKSGAGTVVLTSANTHSGGTVIKNGAIIVENVASLGSGNVTVDLNADFTIGVGGTTAFSKAISGAGDVYINPARTGATQTILSGNSDYTGNTIVCSGTATLKHINATGRNASLSDNGGYVELRSGTVLEFAVGGNYYKEIREAGAAGSVLVTGNGKLSLWNANSYTGGTTVEAGELIARNMKAVGSGVVELSGGNFSVLVDAIGNETNRTFANEITGTGNVSFGTTDGTLIIDRVNDYVGVTTISQGTVELRNLDGTGVNDGKVVRIEDNATLIVTATGDYFKAITGSGTLEKDSVGTLTLMGNNTNFTGTMHLVNGTTILDNSRALGDDTSVVMEDGTVLKFNAGMDNDADFTLNGEVVLDTVTAGNKVTLNGAITGDGPMNKHGDGVLELGNAANNFKGLNIKNGTVYVSTLDALGNGPIVNEAVLELFVAPNTTAKLRTDITSTAGTFKKSGEGLLEIGKQKFVVDMFVMNGGSLEVQLSDGDKYYVQATSGFSETSSSEIIGVYNSTEGVKRGEEQAVKFLALDGAGSDGFSKYTFKSNIARINARDVIDGDKLFFELWLDSFSNAYGDGLSYNAGQAAGAADELAEDNPLLKILEAYENNGGDMKKAFTSLHGEVYKASIAATADLQRNYNDLLLDRRLLCEHCREFKQFRGQYAGTVQRELWATFTGGGNFRTEFDRFSGYNIGRWGIAGGMEHNFARGFFTGVALGYDQANLSMSDLPQKDQFYAFRVAAYGNYTIDDVSIFGQIGYSKNWHDVERNIDFLGVKSQAKYDDDVITMGLDIAKTYHWQNINIIPSIGFTYINLRTPFIEESKADVANLYVNKQRYESFRVPMGVRFNSNFNIQGVNFKPEFRAFYVHELSDHTVRGKTAFASDATNTFLVDSGIRGRDSFRLGLGMQAELFDFLSVGVDYNAEVWSKYTRHDVGGNVKLRW